ncbi:MAG: hypothetical protein IJ092_11800, partial [Atopobiaceae bacterium]|nr:hypothetical protein [Atopobiaceae bacterium]
VLKLFPKEFQKGYKLYLDKKLKPDFNGDIDGSRQHVLIVPRGHEAQVIDQGATNPALLDGVEVTSSVAMGLGNVLDVCGVTFRLVKDGGGVTNVS